MLVVPRPEEGTGLGTLQVSFGPADGDELCISMLTDPEFTDQDSVTVVTHRLTTHI